MVAITIKKGVALKRLGMIGLLLVLSLPGLSGCILGQGVVSAAALDVGVAKRTHEKEAFRKAVADGFALYQTDFEKADCPKSEYELDPYIVNYVAERPPYGLDRAMEMLMDIYQNQQNMPEVRAHALYLVGVATLRRRASDPSRAFRYFRTIQRDFPGTHECAIRRLSEEYEKDHGPIPTGPTSQP